MGEIGGALAISALELGDQSGSALFVLALEGAACYASYYPRNACDTDEDREGENREEFAAKVHGARAPSQMSASWGVPVGERFASRTCGPRAYLAGR